MNHAIIVAAGKSRRMGRQINKVFLPLLNKPLIFYTIIPFQNCAFIEEIIIVAQKNEIKDFEKLKSLYGFDKIKRIVNGGKERQDSVYNGLMSIKNGKINDIIVVHNGSNPLVKETEIIECVNAAKKYGASVAGFPLKDTIKKISNNLVEKTVERDNIFQAQTPQAIKYKLFLDAFDNAAKNNVNLTDDVSLVESIGGKVRIVQSSYENIKVTTQDDLAIAEGILMKRLQYKESFRVGIGQDSHRFSVDKSKKLVLGGITIPNETGLEADSDGDVILHALFNALSQAIGERSLGFYANGMNKKGILDSSEYLQVIMSKLRQKNYRINNIGIMIEALRPKLEGYTNKIRESLSKILGIYKGSIGITYTSGEGLTAFGQGKGMQCFVIVSVVGLLDTGV